MNLQGAVVNFLGDSITAGVGASCPENRFPDVIKREFGLKAANNYGVSGSRIARQAVVTQEPHDRDFCMRLEEMALNADAVVVFGGTNDYGHGEAPLGKPGDFTPETFYGACRYLMNGLLSRYPGKPVAILTPLRRLNENDPGGDGTGRKLNAFVPLSAYREILLAAAFEFSLPVLDLYAVSGIQPENPVSLSTLLPDGLHPSDAGHALIARKIAYFLQQL